MDFWAICWGFTPRYFLFLTIKSTSVDLADDSASRKRCPNPSLPNPFVQLIKALYVWALRGSRLEFRRRVGVARIQIIDGVAVVFGFEEQFLSVDFSSLIYLRLVFAIPPCCFAFPVHMWRVYAMSICSPPMSSQLGMCPWSIWQLKTALYFTSSHNRQNLMESFFYHDFDSFESFILR